MSLHTDTSAALLPMVALGGRPAAEIDDDIDAALTTPWLRPLQIEAEVSISIGEGTFNEMWGAIAAHMNSGIEVVTSKTNQGVLSAPLSETEITFTGARGDREVFIIKLPEHLDVDDIGTLLNHHGFKPCGALELLGYVQHLVDNDQMTAKEMLEGKNGTNEAHPLRTPLLAIGTRVGSGYVPAANVKGRRLFLDAIATSMGFDKGSRLLVTRV